MLGNTIANIDKLELKEYISNTDNIIKEIEVFIRKI